jgi:two-component system chemotaxis response regulator CheB
MYASGQAAHSSTSELAPGSDPERLDVVAIGASAGGVGALRTLLASLPPDFALPVLIVLHLSRAQATTLPNVLQGATRLRVEPARDGVRPLRGHVYVAPPDRHLEVAPDGTLRLHDGPRVNWCRPAADPLFESVAAFYGPHAIAIVLTGSGRDGAAGVRAVRAAGGLTIAEAIDSASYPDMPIAAHDLGRSELNLPLTRIGEALSILAGG